MSMPDICPIFSSDAKLQYRAWYYRQPTQSRRTQACSGSGSRLLVNYELVAESAKTATCKFLAFPLTTSSDCVLTRELAKPNVPMQQHQAHEIQIAFFRHYYLTMRRTRVETNLVRILTSASDWTVLILGLIVLSEIDEWEKCSQAGLEQWMIRKEGVPSLSRRSMTTKRDTSPRKRMSQA